MNMTVLTKNNSIQLGIAITLIAAMVVAGGITLTTSKNVFAQAGEKKFTVKLSGKNEVPPKITKASGTAEFTLSRDGKTITYKVDVKDIDKATMAHIHQGKIGQNGPVVVTLFNTSSSTGLRSGILTQGTITSNNLEGPLKGKQISDLVKLIEDDNAYANVHTQQNPKGEIRGQISK
jgi:CHRD domain